MNFTYVCGPIGTYSIEFKSGLYDDASLYDLRYEVAQLFLSQNKNTLKFKLGYDIEKQALGLEDHIKQLNLPTVQLLGSRTSLISTFSSTDVFIIEVPSTSLFEILTTSKPVILLIDGRGLVLTNSVEKMLRNRTCVVRDKSAFLSAIQSCIEAGLQSPIWADVDSKNSELIRSFTTANGKTGTENILALFKSVLERE